MKKKLFSITSTIAVLALTVWAMASTTPMVTHRTDTFLEPEGPLQDTGKVELKYPIKDFSGIPALQEEEGGMIDPGLPTNIQYSTRYDPSTNQVTIYRKIGGLDVRLPYTMSLDEYMDTDTRNSIINYWDQRMQMESGRTSEASLLNPKFNVGGEGFNNLFGSNLVDIKMQGMAELKIGMSKTKIDNPTLQERLRKPPPTLDFEENIQMNITGNIGDKMKLGVNYNTQALFEFENEIKLEYTGKEDEIIRKIEAGNVSMPLPGTLITGSQSLFGIKSEMQFGKLGVTSLFSQQKGQSQVINIEGGALKQEFEVAIVDYDRNRHFFLAHEFREEFEKSLANLPVVVTPYTITKVEVWVTNKTNNYNDSRNIVGFMDLGEDQNNIYNKDQWSDSQTGDLPSNSANNLYDRMTLEYPDARDINKVSSTLSFLTGGIDYEKIENARLLSASEYTFNAQLGFVSLNNALLTDEVLAVAFEYTYQGQVYKVGEFSNDGITAPNALWLKLLKGSNLSPSYYTWDLMMKNIYSIGAYQVNRDDFKLDVVYVNDSTGTNLNYFPEGSKPDMGGINGELMLRVMNLDVMNTNQEPYPDGVFDYVEGATIMPQNGRIMFPVLKPFGEHLESKLNGQSELIDKYVFNDLYDTTQTVAAQNAEKNKFMLMGSYKSSSSSEISLNAMNIPQGSVVVTAGGIKLTENIDYTVDYTLGRIKIINPGLMQSGTPIQVSLESQSLYALQTKTLMGIHLDYKFNDKFNLGGTLMHLRERPLTQKVNIGDEPIANTIWGLNGAYATESQMLTNILDKLPGYVGTMPSRISFEGEFAQLLPGHPDVVGSEGNAYIDDFEGTKISYDMKNWTSWKLASTPQGQTDKFQFGSAIGDLRYGYERAKAAWYTIDPIFTRQYAETPSHILNDKDQLSNHFIREVFEKELFPDKEAAYGQPTNIPVLNFAFYPNERGPYNFDTNVDYSGYLKNPESRWGGIMRKIETIDFEAANIEYIEFWLMDPFVYEPNSEGGDLYFNLGDISEDILRDSRKSFEQGLPGPGEPDLVDETTWGRVPRTQSMVNAFSSDADAREAQDIGLDGLDSESEQSFFTSFIDAINQKQAAGELSAEAYQKLIGDPSADDYHYYRGSDYDAEETNVLDRYKEFNGAEGNSVASENSPESYSTAATTVPDVEDINLDNTLAENENYFQYKVELKPEKMVVGENYITTMVEREVELKNGNKEKIKWYQFKIPISEPDTVIGSIADVRSVRFMRMYMHSFTDTTILRFATLDLVRGDWRKYTNTLYETSDNAAPNSETEFVVSAVNIEENSDRVPVNYVLPPGIDRVIDPSNPQVRQLNEQSLALTVKDLGAKDSRAVYKTVNMDFRQYKKLKMEVHAEEITGYPLENDEVTAFIRLGSDYKNNYYEYEIPLKLTPHGTYGDNNADRLAVWPEENRLEVVLDKFTQLKLRRNDAKRQQGESISLSDVYIWNDPDKPNNYLKIKGNPNLSNVKTVMLGVRVRGNGTKSVEVWMNELRLTDFDEDGGWAANARMKIDLSDLGSVSLAGKRSTAGFGSIDQSVTERSQEDFTQYDVATSLEAGKMLGPQSRVSVPVYFGVSKAVTNPKYYALDPDIPMDVALKNAESTAAKDSIKRLSQTIVERKSLNFTNVRLMPKEKANPGFLSPSNLSATYAYNETKLSDVNTEHSIDKTYQGMLAYTYLARPKPIEPFKNSKMFAGKAATLIRDFNFYIVPNQVSYRWEMVRDYNEVQLRNLASTEYNLAPSVSRSFDWNRFFDLNYNLTKALRLEYKAATNARIDEPSSISVVNKHLYPDEYRDWRDSVLHNIYTMGRTTNFTHNFNASYTVPINKIPMLDWTTANLRYGATYSWRMAPLQMPEIGNTILNTNSIQAGGQLNFTTLYNKSGYLKELNRKYNTVRRPTNNQAQNNKRTERYNREGLEIVKDKPLVIKHNLRTEEVSVRVYDKGGRPVQGDSKALGPNRVEFIPKADAPEGRVMVTGTVEDVTTPLTVARDYFFLLLTGVKNASVQYNQTNGTILPGYMEDANFMGMSNGNPGLGFVFGAQNKNIGMEALNSGWLTNYEGFNSAFIMTTTDDFQSKVNIEPIKGLKIDLNGDRRYQEAMNSYYLPSDGIYSNPLYSGSFNISTILWKTSFEKVGKDGGFPSNVYDQFLQNRSIVSARLGGVGYGSTSQDVLIPSFIAAYSGKEASNVSLNLFPSIAGIRPNWRVSYDGLSKIKGLQKYIKSFEITHAYRAYQSITSFVSNLEHDGVKTDLEENIIPLYQVNTLTLSEQFNPLIQFNLTWVNSLNTRIEFKKSRIMSLSLANSQVIENYTNDFVVGAGYRINKLNLNIGNKSFSSDVNLRADVTIGETLAIIRKIEEDVNQLTSGQKKVTVKFTADYSLSDKFNVQLYYDTNVNNPYIANSYPMTTTNFGMSFRFVLAQ